jgi:AcrR family transcriptional regulator
MTSLRERGKQQRVARILGAARTLLREHPDALPRTEAIAELAEVSPATVFNLVGTRDRLWAALADELVLAAQERVEELPDGLDPQERARRIVTVMAEALVEDAPVHRAVLAHWRESAGLMRQRPSGALVECFEAAGAGDADHLVALVVTGCTGAAHQWAAEMISDRTLARRSRDFVDLAFAAAATTP